MRLLQVLHSHGYGGAERHCLALMKGLRELGHELLYAGPADSWLTEECRQAGLPTEHLRMAGLFDLPSALKLRRLARAWGADVVHGHLVRGAWYAGWAARGLPGVAALCTAHATTAAKHMRRCDHIVAVSEAVRANLLQHGHPPARVSVIHNGMPDGPTRPAPQMRAALGIGADEFAVFSAGRFIRDKGQDLMVQAVRACAPSVRLYLAGDPDTPFGAEVRRLAAGDARIRFLGYRGDVQAILPAFDAYLSASRREAFGLSLAEACAARLPIVATAVGGVPEIVEHGRTGLLVDSEDVAGLAAALERLLIDRPLADALAERARARFLERFTVDRMVRDTAALCERLKATVAAKA